MCLPLSGLEAVAELCAYLARNLVVSSHLLMLTGERVKWMLVMAVPWT